MADEEQQQEQEPTSAPYRMLTVLNGGGATTCTFAGLLKYTSYEFFMVPFYKSVDGKPSNTKQGRTLEDGELLFSSLSIPPSPRLIEFHHRHHQISHNSRPSKYLFI